MNPSRLLDALPDFVFVIDADGVLTYVSGAVERLLGWRPQEWVGRSVLDLVHPDDLAGAISSIGALVGHDQGTPIELRAIDVDGVWHWMEIIGANMTSDVEVAGLVCVGRDITRRRMWEVAGTDVARFQQVVQHAASITLLLDGHGSVVGVSGAFARLLGHDPSGAVGQSLELFVDAGHRSTLLAALARIRAGRRSISVELSMTRAGGATNRPIRFELVNLLDDPVVGGIVASGYDVTDLQLARDELEHLGRHDVLTGLANRSLLITGIEKSLSQDSGVAVVYIDLDRFKPVNDLYGQETGDSLLLQVADRLRRIIRPGDMVARVGGDEFVVLAANIGPWPAPRRLGERIEAELAAPYLLDVGPLRIGASVGVAVSDPHSTVASLLADADVKMYDSKSQRRGAARPISEDRRSAIERRRLADELAVGLTRGEVVAHLQPIVDVATGALVSLEALARWNHPVLGLLGTAAFIDLVDDSGLDLAFGDAVLHSAARTIQTIHDQRDSGVDGPRLAINLSIGQLSNPDMTDRLRLILSTYSLTLSDLVIEITERSTLSRHTAHGSSSPDETLRDLHAAGAQLSLDDFGTGHSSLTHMRRFPLASIKIDQTFVSRMCRQPEDLAVVEVVIGLARNLGLAAIAEGVETIEQLEALRALGCDFAQGFLIAAPLDATAALQWVSERP